MKQQRYTIGFTILLIMGVLFASWLVLTGVRVTAAPSGAEVTNGTPETAPAATPGNDSAYAGNVTSIQLTGTSTTQTWQGYFGNVTGAIQLADASSNVLYNWSQLNPTGEVYASINSSIVWANTQCLNFTANGTQENSAAEVAGGTNLGGINLTHLESLYNIGSSDVDGVDETFNSPGGGHDEFFTSNLNFTIGECQNAAIFDSTGQSVDGNFEEVLLYEPESTSVIFASLLESDLNGFNSETHDFEMLVLEDGHAGDSSATIYFFYIELDG